MDKKTAQTSLLKALEQQRKYFDLPKDAPEYKLVKEFIEKACEMDAAFNVVLDTEPALFRACNFTLDTLIEITASYVRGYAKMNKDNLTWDDICGKLQLRIMEIEAEEDAKP